MCFVFFYIFTDIGAEVVLLKGDVCLAKFSVLNHKDVAVSSVIFKETQSFCGCH